MADRIIKPDSGNDVVIQNNGGTRKIEVTNSGDVEVTGDFKATTVKATNLKANDGTASLEIADSSGDIGFSGNTNLKIKLPSAGGIYESDGSTEILTESSGAVSLKNTTIDPTATFPAGMIIKKSLITYAQTGTAISTNLTNYTDIGVGGSFTVKKDSSTSYLKFILEQGMTHGNNSALGAETDLCLTSSNNTSHSNDNSLYGSLTYKNYTQYVGGSWYGRYSTSAIFNVGTRVTTNLTSYSAGDTLYIRIFIKSSNTSYTHFFAHAGSHYILTVEEISK